MEKYVHFEFSGHRGWGRVDGDKVLELSEAPWTDPKPSGRSFALPSLKLLAPAKPSKIVCVGLNYKDHASEMKESLPEVPKIFLKPPSALADPDQAIAYPPSSTQVDHESELALVIGKRAAQGGASLENVFGYTCANDVTARDLQRKDGQWTRAKGFDGFCPLGPVLVRGLDVSDLKIECRVAGTVKQSARTSNMIFKPAQILAFISRVMTLEAGDVILTGTPSGIGPVKRGELMEVEIENIGVLRNTLF